jgi:dimeric dUTPase (all-alpha-NTP-PPase superfamily)
MNLAKLYEAQAKLDADIIEKKGLQGMNLLPNKILALNVELGELAQEVQGEWKYWKEHTTRDDVRVLDEFVDCLHFALSIGLEDDDIDINDDVEDIRGFAKANVGITGLFNCLFVDIAEYGESSGYKTLIHYANMVFGLLRLGNRLGFTDEQIEAQYFKKNAVNHHRQEVNY